jgi:TolB-like protein
MSVVNPGPPIRFGVFELNPKTGELRKQGLRVRLSQQPSQLLLFLLETPGRIRTREELQERLWRTNTFVDFDHSLNKIVHALRETLGDSATNPRFIETVSGQGYRFIPIPQQPSRRASKSRVSQEIESVAVLPFVTESGEPEIAFIASQITTQVIDELSRISGIRVLAYSTVKDYKEERANPQLVGKDLGVEGVVFGEFVRHNSDLFLHVELVDVADGTQLWGANLKQDCENLIDYSEQVAKVISRQLKPILSADQIKVSRIISKPSSSVSRKVSDNKSNSILFPVKKKA